MLRETASLVVHSEGELGTGTKGCRHDDNQDIQRFYIIHSHLHINIPSACNVSAYKCLIEPHLMIPYMTTTLILKLIRYKSSRGGVLDLSTSGD